jgi:hypothetical protein
MEVVCDVVASSRLKSGERREGVTHEIGCLVWYVVFVSRKGSKPINSLVVGKPIHSQIHTRTNAAEHSHVSMVNINV